MKLWSLKLLLSRTMSVVLQITYCIQYCCVEFPTLRNARRLEPWLKRWSIGCVAP